MREPDDDGWDADGFDGGGIWQRGEIDGGASEGRGRRAEPAIREFRPGLEALRLAIHRPEEVGDRLEAALFRDELQRTAFKALVDHEDLHEAIDSSDPAVRALLVRLTVEEPVSRPDEVVSQLVRDSARHELQLMTAEARTSADAVKEALQVAGWVQELDDPKASVTATARLVAWLVVRAQTSDSGRTA